MCERSKYYMPRESNVIRDARRGEYYFAGRENGMGFKFCVYIHII